MASNNNRDDFSPKTIREAAERVGLRCSYCGCLTKAAKRDGKSGVANYGVAAHICAAAPGGPRYDATMTSEERKSIDNCIWLCQNHAKLIDSDIIAFPKELLLAQKREAEKGQRMPWKAAKVVLQLCKMAGLILNKQRKFWMVQ